MSHSEDKLLYLLYSKTRVNPIYYFMLLFSLSAQAGPVRGNGATDPSTYEAITGESADEEKAAWDSFYRSRESGFKNQPVGFLRDHLTMIPKGRAFIPAMGIGQNAIYLAKKGFLVEGVDISEVAIDTAHEAAKKQGVSIKASASDLDQFKYPTDRFDLIVVSQFYRDSLIPKFKAALKKGAYILFYEKRDTGKPQKQVSPDDFLVKSSDLKAALKDLDIRIFQEYRDHGTEVIGVLARKP